jgi:hypothetical protein
MLLTFELLYLLVAYSMGFILLYIGREKSSRTLSSIAASSKSGYLVFLIGLTVSGVLFLLATKELVKIIDSSNLLALAGIVLFGFQCLTGVIPDTAKYRKRHMFAAIGLSLSMITYTLTAVLLHAYNSAALAIVIVLLGVMGLSMLLAIIRTNQINTKGEYVFFSCWHLAFLLAVLSSGGFL